MTYIIKYIIYYNIWIRQDAMKKRNIIFGMIGIKLDFGFKEKRHRHWRPTVSIAKNDITFDRMELWYQPGSRESERLKNTIEEDIKALTPKTVLNFHPISFKNPWDFEEVYLKLYDFAKSFEFDLDKENYYLHMTTGTHVTQVCYFALCEANILPCKILQTGEDPSIISENERRLADWKQTVRERKRKGLPTHPKEPELLDRSKGIVQVIDLKSERYKKIASRFHEEKASSEEMLKSGIKTKNKTYNDLISEIEEVAQLSSDPILLRGQTGAGKSHLAKKIYELKKTTKNPQAQIRGDYVEVNCATIRGDGAMSALFGHKKGSFTGATTDRKGLLKEADKGILFLDEIGELGGDEQAMLLKAIEDKEFRPLGSEKLENSNFMLICGTNRDLRQMTLNGSFREDLLARIDIWEFVLPALKERAEDIEPNVDYELNGITREFGKLVRFSKEAREHFLTFATKASWPSNFRDLSASIRRMAVLSQKNGIIDIDTVNSEICRLSSRWEIGVENVHSEIDQQEIKDLVTNPETFASMTPLEKYEISWVIKTVRKEKTLKSAADKLFAGKQNTTDRLRKKLLRYDINPSSV